MTRYFVDTNCLLGLTFLNDRWYPECKGRQISQRVGRDVWVCQACQQAGRDQHHEYVIDLKRDRRISAGGGETR